MNYNQIYPPFSNQILTLNILKKNSVQLKIKLRIQTLYNNYNICHYLLDSVFIASNYYWTVNIREFEFYEKASANIRHA